MTLGVKPSATRRDAAPDGASSRPIDEYALLSDCHSAALVSRDGSVDWLCVPRFDSPALFTRILGASAGHWSIHPVGAYTVERRYRPETLVLETTFRATGGTVRLTDALALGRNERGHDLGGDAPHALLRRVECIEGYMELACEFAPRPEYGLVLPVLERGADGVTGRGGASLMLLSTDIPFTVSGATAHAKIHLASGEAAGFALQHRTSAESPPERWPPDEITRRLEDTAAGWESWSKMHQRYDGPWRDLVSHSGRVLQALTYFPTGAIIAAPTTSLPESVGGGRNWDYRFSWVRDATLTLEALWVAACPDEAHRFFDFIANAALSRLVASGHMQIMFGVGGEHDLSERELDWLPGWRDSAPVRVGNAAWTQRQLDVYGELLGAAHRLRDQINTIGKPGRDLLVAAADAAARSWRDTDHGIWEIRDQPRHFLHSKLMCWVALDRAISLAPLLDADGRVREWTDAREEVRHAIEENGWSSGAAAFTQSFDSDVLDASSLLIPIVGFLSPTDPRVLSTIDAIAGRLTDQRGLVFRYAGNDGLSGREGAFMLCTFWLAHALALSGQVDRARRAFEVAAGFASDLGLMSEEVDSTTGELLGNFPQAFSHVGLVNAAWAITQAERSRTP